MQPEEKYFKFAKYFFSSICAEYLTHHSTEDKHDARENPNGQSGDALRITELFLIHTQQFHVKQLQYGLASQNMSRVYKLSPKDNLKLVNNRQMIINFLSILFMPRYFFFKSIFHSFIRIIVVQQFQQKKTETQHKDFKGFLALTLSSIFHKMKS